MNLLAGTTYDPGTAVSKSTATLIAMTAIDTTNLRLSVVAPSHGILFVRMGVVLSGATSYPAILLGVMEGATVRGRVAPAINIGQTGANQLARCTAEFLITGLTPGNTYNLDAAYGVELTVASSALQYGGPNNTTTNDASGGFTYEIWDPRPVPTAQPGVTNGLPIQGGAIPDANAGASGGLLISGSNAGTTTLGALTCTGTFTISDGIVVTRSTAGGTALSLTGNGAGLGLSATGGASGVGGRFLSGGSNAAGLTITGSGTGSAINATGGSTGGDALSLTAGNGSGSTPGGHGIHAIGGNATTTLGGIAGNGFNILGGAGAASTNGAGSALVAAGGGTTTVSGADAFNLTGTGNRHGLISTGAGTGSGFNLNGGSSGNGLTVSGGTNGDAAYFLSGTNAHAIKLVANGTGDGFNILGGASGNSINAQGNVTFVNRFLIQDGIDISCTTAGRDGIKSVGSTTGRGALIQGGASASGARIASGGGGQNGLELNGNGAGTGLTISGGTSGGGITISSGTNGTGILCTGNGTGPGILVSGGASAVGIEVDGGTDGILVTAAGGDALDLTSVSGGNYGIRGTFGPNAIAAITYNADTYVYHGRVELTRNSGSSTDEWTATWFRNGVPLTAGITVPKIEVIKRVDGLDLIAATAMTQIGTSGSYKYDEAINRITPGEAYIAVISATIDGSTRTWEDVITRDS